MLSKLVRLDNWNWEQPTGTWLDPSSANSLSSGFSLHWLYMIIIPKKNETAKLHWNGADSIAYLRNGLSLSLHTIRWSHCTAGILNGSSERHLPLAHSRTLSTVNLVCTPWICWKVPFKYIYIYIYNTCIPSSLPKMVDWPMGKH